MGSHPVDSLPVGFFIIQRAFSALGYLGWFISPWVLFVTTGAVVIVTWRRQFVSSAWRAMGS
jgi:uncharacterized membrane protein